jgi:hypothetical protein
MKRMIPFDERYLFGLTEPGDEQRRGGAEIALVQEGIDDQREGLGRAEAVKLFAPER